MKGARRGRGGAGRLTPSFLTSSLLFPILFSFCFLLIFSSNPARGQEAFQPPPAGSASGTSTTSVEQNVKTKANVIVHEHVSTMKFYVIF